MFTIICICCCPQAPVHVVLPHCTSRVSAMTREPVIKADIGGTWIELKTQEVTIEEKKVPLFSLDHVSHTHRHRHRHTHTQTQTQTHTHTHTHTHPHTHTRARAYTQRVPESPPPFIKLCITQSFSPNNVIV